MAFATVASKLWISMCHFILFTVSVCDISQQEKISSCFKIRLDTISMSLSGNNFPAFSSILIPEFFSEGT